MAASMDQAAIDRRAKEIETEYMSSLADLNVNSKPLINMLTILAEENLDYAPVIVNAVEKHLAKVQPDVKLPIMYLVDSIVKNVGKQYQLLFSQVIVNMFCGVFETVNERVREKMFSLRQTWNEVFPQSKLYALDIKINSIDPGWPITAQLKPSKSPAIHVNPIFLKNQVTGQNANAQIGSNKLCSNQQIPDPTLDMQQQLRDKQRELLELQNKKLELELMATKKRIEEQEKQLVLQTASVSKEPAGDLKRPASAIGSSAVPPPRGRIAPPNAAMINLVKSRDPRLARQQAQLVAQMTAASTNSTPTMVGGVQVPPHHPIALDPSSGKPLSIKERLGRIPKRTDPRIKAAQAPTSDSDRKKANNAPTASTTSHSLSPSHRSRGEYDGSKKREKKDETSKSGRSPSSKSSNPDKKKSTTEMSSPKSSSPLKKKPSSISEKSPSRNEKTSPKLREGKVNKGSKSVSRRPGDTSKNSDDSSVSPSSSSENLMPVVNESKDVDLRLLIPEKKLKLDQQQPPTQQQAKLINKPLPDQKKALGEAVVTDNVPSQPMAISRDVDLRIPPADLLKDVAESIMPNVDPAVTSTTITTNNIEDTSIVDTIPQTSVTGPVLPTDGLKKRPSNHKLEEPAIKKTKSEKLDVLFGNEDVDLRKLTGPLNSIETITPLPPPPPIISDPNTRIMNPNSLQNDSVDIFCSSPSSKSALEAVRAKIAEATKNKDRDKLGRPLLYNKLSDDPVERRRSLVQGKSLDVDLRQQQFQNHDAFGDDNSQEGMNANIKIIVAQAQDQMEKGEITPEQYNILMKQVIQLNETQKIRQAQRMEMMNRSQQAPMSLQASDDNANTNTGDEMASFSPKQTDDSEIKPSDPSPTAPQVVNDFRGKITPFEIKPKIDSQISNAVPILGDNRQRDPRRPLETRFGPQWGIRGPMAVPNAMPPKLGPNINQRPPGPSPMVNPWDQSPFPVINTNLVPPPIGPRFPPVPINNAPPANILVPGVSKMNDSVRTINIDGIQREIRFYDDIAVIFMSWDEPKEIGFQKGSRMVVVDDRDSFELSFNECYKAITIEGKVYQMKLGSPTRELYIDNSWYECYFGDPPTNIVLDGINRVFKISGPAPQVKIGNSRNDLVAGKINMIVNAEVIVPVFLDSQVQMFEIYGQMHKLQFADFLLTVIIDDQPFPVEYGGLPKVFKLRGKDFYIRFTAVPKLVVPGRVYIRDMIRTPLHRDLRTPPRDQSLLTPFVQTMNNLMPPMGIQHSVPSLFPAAAAIPPKPINMHPTATGLDYLTNLMPHSASHINVSNNLAGYQIQSDDKPVIPPATTPAPASVPAKTSSGLNLPILQNLNIDELYQKIVAAGILGKTSSIPAKTSATTSATINPSTSSSTSSASKLERALEEEVEEIEPVFLNKADTLKRRQSAIVSQLFMGMQCSSCGVRFPPEQTMKYSQHLDWHFRQNRRDRDSARKAHSRKWYYDVSDWIQYEEIEDLEEREKNWFESQQTEQIEFNGDGESGGGRAGAETPPPSCPAGSDETSKRCHMCHDEFQQFYSEDTEEWHLRNAIRVDECTYHPLCYEDYKSSLTLDESAMNASNEEGDQSKTDEEVKIKQEAISDADDSIKEITLDDDDDVIVLPPTEDVVTEIPDDDDIETLDSHSTAEEARTTSEAGTVPAVDDDNSKLVPSEETPSDECNKVATPQEPRIIETRIDDDIAIQEPSIEKIDVNDLDESDTNIKSCITTDSIPLTAKVKEEPKDADEVDEEDELFEDVGTIESSMVESSKDADTVDVEAVASPTPPLESSSQSSLKPSIDGNVELQDNLTTGIITNRIKINITKAKTTSATSNSSTTTISSVPSGGSSIAVLISGGGVGGSNYDNMNDDLLYDNLDDIHGGHNENSQSNSSSLMMMHEEEQDQDSNNKGSVEATAEETTEIDYDLKPSLQGIVLTRQPRVENGFETSGLCSIM